MQLPSGQHTVRAVHLGQLRIFMSNATIRNDNAAYQVTKLASGCGSVSLLLGLAVLKTAYVLDGTKLAQL